MWRVIMRNRTQAKKGELQHKKFRLSIRERLSLDNKGMSTCLHQNEFHKPKNWENFNRKINWKIFATHSTGQ
jgi:hypothetical protein